MGWRNAWRQAAASQASDAFLWYVMHLMGCGLCRLVLAQCAIRSDNLLVHQQHPQHSAAGTFMFVICLGNLLLSRDQQDC